MSLPPEHPLRAELNYEVHARPPDALAAPCRVSYLAMLREGGPREAAWQHMRQLALRFGAPPPAEGASHWAAELGAFRIRWEQHTEFHRVMFIRDGVPDRAFAEPAIAAVPADWVAGLPGQLLVAADLELRPEPRFDPAGHGIAALVGSHIGSGGQAFTDFRISGDGFGRFLMLAGEMSPAIAGRNAQRLLEIDTYRMMALLALPVARALAPQLGRWEQELAEIAAALTRANSADEPGLLHRLTHLASEIESQEAATRYRFSAAAAYYALVQRRIAELREERIEGLQTFQEFTERRLAPAMDTCQSSTARQEALSRRVQRVTQLLQTRVDIAREAQNGAVLLSMNRRAALQLRLQQTVEGLSVAAITYYIVGVWGYAAKALAPRWGLNADIMIAAAIPVAALFVLWGLRRARGRLRRDEHD